MSYVFQGVSPFIKVAARADPLVKELHLSRCENIWHVGRIQDALGQLPKLEPARRAALFAEVVAIRHGLAATLAGIDAAIAEVKFHCPVEADPDTHPDADKQPVKSKRPAAALKGE